jgi:hypothetical protein
MVMKISFSLGMEDFRCRAASKPFNSGMAMSSTMMSGCNLAAAFRSSRPVLAVPTTSHRGSSTRFKASTNI